MRLVMLTPEDWEALSNSIELDILLKSTAEADRLAGVLEKERVISFIRFLLGLGRRFRWQIQGGIQSDSF